MRQVYLDQAVPQLQTAFEYKNSMAIPQIKKIVINMGLGEALTNGRAIENATQALRLISGQKPMVTRARKSIATFKLREGMPLGLMVTLRGHRMYDFYDRLVNASLPRIRDFRGVSRKSFDGRGNFALGIREHAIFPEIDYNTIDKIRPLQVIIVTSANTDREAVVLLENMGMPFTREVVTD
jgi:large subunit ribosomal protein L5